MEYRYNDALASRIKAELADKGVAVQLTRTPGEDVSLMGRARKSANHNLFVSLHNDSVQPQFIEMVGDKPRSLKARGYSIFISRKNAEYARSLGFARYLGDELCKAGLRPSVHHGEPIRGENRKLADAELGIYEFDDLAVLKHAKTPAVLVEAAVLVHPEDEACASTAEFRDIFSYAMAKAILKFEMASGKSLGKKSGQSTNL